jgi:hypothetical protein
MTPALDALDAMMEGVTAMTLRLRTTQKAAKLVHLKRADRLLAADMLEALAAEVRALQHDNDALREAANAEAQENETQRETIAGLTARVEALRSALKHIAKTWPDDFAARHARAALSGEAPND